MAAMDDQPDFIVRRAPPSVARIARHVSTAIALGALSLGLAAGSVAHAGVPLPVVAETTGIPSLAAVVTLRLPFPKDGFVSVVSCAREQFACRIECSRNFFPR